MASNYALSVSCLQDFIDLGVIYSPGWNPEITHRIFNNTKNRFLNMIKYDLSAYEFLST